MTSLFKHALAAIASVVALAAPNAAAADSGTPALAPPPALVAAQKVAYASQAAMLAATQAGARTVAVGDHGVILLSDDGGLTHRQARSVPVDVTLTGVSFVDARRGWAVGHRGVVLGSQDGGETWRILRSDLRADRPLFAVHFFDAQNGVAVGLWSLVLVTADGGTTWSTSILAPAPDAKKADLNLYGLFPDAKGNLYAPTEHGMVLQSRDRGRSWSYLGTGYSGSLWTGVATPDGALLVAGLRGSMYRSDDAGASWQRVDIHAVSSVTALAVRGASVHGVGLDGLMLRSTDGGRNFETRVRPDRLPMTTLALNVNGDAVLFSRQGAVRAAGHDGPTAASAGAVK
jgi:photosystem II stability/assembly factor-like uncharacterized protein